MLKNITLSAEVTLIKKARERAKKEKNTLNSVFRDWLNRHVAQDMNSKDYKHLMKKLNYVTPGRSFSREEMNER